MNEENRYSGALNKKYELIMSAWPQQNTLRKLVAEEIKEYAKNTNPTILELGAGRGETTEFILNEMQPKEFVIIENDKTMVNILKNKFEQSYIKYIFDDIFNVINNLSDNYFDIITQSWVIHNFAKDNQKKLLTKLYSKLKNQGLLIMFDKILPDDEKTAKKYIKEQMDLITSKLACDQSLKKEILEHEKSDLQKKYLIKESEIINTLKHIGFNDIKIIKRITRDVVIKARK